MQHGLQRNFFVFEHCTIHVYFVQQPATALPSGTPLWQLFRAIFTTNNNNTRAYANVPFKMTTKKTHFEADKEEDETLNEKDLRKLPMSM